MTILPNDWRTAAACRDEDPELFFPKGHEGPWQLVIEEAKTVCRRCPAVDACLTFALDNNIQHGIYGGLTDPERTSLKRSAKRHNLSDDTVTEKTAQARQPQPKPRTLRSLFDNNTKRIIHGHLAWTGPAKPSFEGRSYNPKQVAFILDRGRNPVGRVLTTCSLSGCVLPAHVADDEERMQCGTRPGYQRHLKNGETPCDPCRQANSDADNRLRRTGTSKTVTA
jgi:hypothetical protein